jgi:hypothetical protein
MKRLVCLISTEGKTPKQISDETMKAFEKYQKVEKKCQKVRGMFKGTKY